MFLTASDELYVEAGYMQMYTEGASIRLEDGGAYIYTALTTGILANSFFLEVGGSMFDIDSYGYFFINGQDSMIISAGSGLNLWGETSMEIGTFGTLNMNASTIETNAIEVINYIDNLISIVQAAIQNLQEYRTALISASVTGKIDVHGFSSVEGVIKNGI